MLRRIWTSLKRDSLIYFRNGFLLITLAVAVIYTVTVRWLIPAESAAKPLLAVVDRTASGLFAASLRASDDAENVVFFPSQVEMESFMRENPNTIGLALVDAEPLPQVTYTFQGSENNKVRNLLVVTIQEQLRILYSSPHENPLPVRQEVLGSLSSHKIPFNHLWIPALLFSDAVMIGLAFMATLIFAEKEEGTLRAYLVSPGRTWEYVLSKSLSLAMLSVIVTVILLAFTMGTAPNYIYAILVMLSCGLFAGLLGAWLASYFENISQFFGPVIALVVILTLPLFSYFLPSFSPPWLQWIPTYPLVFGLREALFPTGNPQIIFNALLITLLLNVTLLWISSRVLMRQVVKI